MPDSSFVKIDKFIVYDGTNGAEVATYLGGSVVSDNGSVLVVRPPAGSDMTITPTDHCSATFGVWQAGAFPSQWTSPAALTGTADGISVAVPLLLLGGSVDRVVTWNTPFADANYKVRFMPDANTLGRITPVVKSGTKTASGLTVTISAGLAVTVAGVLHVLGTT